MRIYAVVIYSCPYFGSASCCSSSLASSSKWLPISGRIDPVIGASLKTYTNLYAIDALINGNLPALWSVLQHLVLPTAALGLIQSGLFVRMTRVNVIETLHADYISAARARGIRERVLIYGHALNNA